MTFITQSGLRLVTQGQSHSWTGPFPGQGDHMPKSAPSPSSRLLE